MPDPVPSQPNTDPLHLDEARGEASSRPLEMAIEWLLRSGIYILKPEDQNYGAVYSHYGAKQRHHELVYAEVTGYGMSLLKYLIEKRPGAPFIDYARASGNWLIRWAEKNHGIIAMGLSRGKEVREAYAFDNGICCKGLLDLFALTADERYLICAERIAEWLVSKALNEDGSVKPVLDLDTGRFVEDRRTWYKVSGSFHAKIAMPLLQLFAIKNDGRLRDAAGKICEWAIGQQQHDGNFPVNKTTKMTFLHFHCYTIEALLYAYACERSQRFIDAAEKAVNWALKMQRRDGTLPRWDGGRALGTANDVQAQIVRIFSLMHMLRRRSGLVEASQKAAESLLRLQGVDREGTVHGGFIGGDVGKYRFFQRRSFDMTSWATMFAIQALYFVQEATVGDFYTEAKRLF